MDRPPPLGELAWTVTSTTLPVLFERLRTRPEPHNIDFTAGILELAAETLNRSPFSVFREYMELTGKRSPEVAERLWKISFPGALINIKPVEPGMGILINFPVDRLNKAGAMQ